MLVKPDADFQLQIVGAKSIACGLSIDGGCTMHVNLKAYIDADGLNLSVAVSERFVVDGTIASFSDGKEVSLWC